MLQYVLHPLLIMSHTKNKVAFLTNIISPYRKVVFTEISKDENIDLKIFSDAINEFDRDWHVTVDGLSVEKTKCISIRHKEKTKGSISFNQELTKHIPYGLLYQLFKYNPDKVISLELGIRTAIAAIYCRLMRKKLIIWSYHSRVSGEDRSFIRSLWRKILLKQAHSVIGMGKQAREVLLKWQVPNYKIVDIPNAADNLGFIQTLNGEDADRKIETIRATYAGDKKLAIVVGRLIPLKGIKEILMIWALLPEEVKSQWKLLFIGTGPYADIIKKQDSEYIELIGYVPTDSMPYWYSAADLHIFPTLGDVWGLVVNEASVCETPTLCSNLAGCFDDLINEETGYELNLAHFGESLAQTTNVLNSSDLKEKGKRVNELIKEYEPSKMAEIFKTVMYK